MTVHRLVSIAACSAAAMALVGAQQSSPSPARSQATFESYSTAVLVDVVVRDGKGRPVTDLTAADFELREDGTSQAIGSFTRVSRGSGIGINVALKDPGAVTSVGSAAPPDDGTPEAEERHPSVTALVFDALSAEAVNLCQRAALEALPMEATSNARVGVFSTTPAVTPLQAYTDDPTLVRQAVRKVMPAGAGQRPDADVLQAMRERRETLDRESQNALAMTSTGGGAGLSGTSANIGQVGDAAPRRPWASCGCSRPSTPSIASSAAPPPPTPCSRSCSRWSRCRAARRWCSSRRACRRRRPWRPTFRPVVEAANRANITVYAIDASGLRAVSGTLETRREIEEAGKERMRQLSSATNYTDQPMTRLVERAEDLLQARLARRPGPPGARTPAASWSARPTTCAARSVASTKTRASTTC